MKEVYDSKLSSLQDFVEELKEKQSVCASSDDLHQENHKLRILIQIYQLFDLLDEMDEYGPGLSLIGRAAGRELNHEMGSLQEELDIRKPDHQEYKEWMFS